SGKWMSAAVKWASEMGYVKGTGQNKFDPNGTLDRQQLATMLYRFTSQSFDTSEVNKKALDNFEDGNTTASWALEAMTWAVSVKVINGNDKNLLIPEVYATRAQVAQILLNYKELFEGSDETGLVNADLVLSMNNTKYTEAKNVVFMIGDGMGFNIVEMTEHLYKDKLYNGKLAMNYIPQLSSHTSYSQNDQTTDSAAGGSALATGLKTSNQTIAQSPDGEEIYKTTLELAAEKGKSTGVIATKSVTDATPASFTAHTNSRYNQTDIAEQQMEKLADGSLDLVLGGGYEYFDKDLLEEYKSNNSFNFSQDFNAVLDTDLPVLGLFSEEEINTFDEESPRLADMTGYALNKLSQDENGFFLMVEGSQIDSYAHNNKLEKSAHECYEFDCAVAVVLDFIKNNPDTVLIITADHETGGLIIPEELDDRTAQLYKYLTGSHTYRNVPVYAIGYGVEALDKTNENVDLPIFVASLMSDEAFGHRSENYNLISGYNSEDTDVITNANSNTKATENGLEIYFGDPTEIDIPVSAFNINSDDVKNARAIHIELTNIDDKYCVVPSIYLTIGFTVDPHIEYLNPGESQVVSYILPSVFWEDGVFASIDSFGLFIAEPYFDFDSYQNDLLMGDITVTNRTLEK
ncbi:MAG: alkaline phosphatase, partial [Clostridia bacterium]|nr:alkaline phosphatase [Clostridia bacterium]